MCDFAKQRLAVTKYLKTHMQRIYLVAQNQSVKKLIIYMCIHILYVCGTHIYDCSESNASSDSYIDELLIWSLGIKEFDTQN